MKNRIVRNWFSKDVSGRGQEKPVGRSETVQGEAYSVKELMERARQGTLPEIDRKGQYFEEDMDIDDPDFEKVAQSDLVERAEHIEKTARMQSEIVKARKEHERKKGEEAKQRAENTRSAKNEQDDVRQASEAKPAGKEKEERSDYPEKEN